MILTSKFIFVTSVTKETATPTGWSYEKILTAALLRTVKPGRATYETSPHTFRTVTSEVTLRSKVGRSEERLHFAYLVSSLQTLHVFRSRHVMVCRM